VLRKIVLTAYLFVITVLGISQAVLPDNFQIGNYVEIFSIDSIKIYFNCTGTVRHATVVNGNGNFNVT